MSIPKDVDRVVAKFKQMKGFVRLLPEVGTNVAYAKEGAMGLKSVAAVPGRLRKAKGRAATVYNAEYGVSSHMARSVLAAMAFDPTTRSAMNVVYNPATVKKLRKLRYSVVFVDRMREPPRVRRGHNKSMDWVVSEGVKKNRGKVPNAIYDKGAVGKEPMIRLFAQSPEEFIPIIKKLV